MLKSLQDTRSNTSLAIFCVLAFAISWSGYLPLFAAAHGIPFFENKLWQGCLVLTAFGPALAAWVATLYEKPPTTIRSRLHTSFFKRVPTRWWLTAAFLPAVLLLCANGLVLYILPGPGPAVPPASAAAILLTSLISIIANPCEEIGWRGFLLFRLQARLSSVGAALLTSVVTALWHVPLFLLPQSPMRGYPFWTWALGAVTHSILLTWLYNVSVRSLAVTSLFHISFNIFGSILGTRTFLGLAAVEVVAVVALLLLLGPSLGRATDNP